MTKARLPLALTLAAAAFAAAPAHAAGIQEDITNCAAEAIKAELIEEDGTSLRFVSDKGNRNRTLVLKAIQGRDNAKLIECRMSRSKVKEVVEQDD